MIKKRASNVEVKKINRNRIFRYLNKYDRVSKPDISSELGISMPTVLQNINELMKQGLVDEVGEFQSTGGRKAIAIAPVRNLHYALGIDITQNHIGVVLTDLSGDVLKHKRVYKPFFNNREYYKEMAAIALEFKNSEIGSDKKFLGVGISIPGIVDTRNNKILFSHALNLTNIETDRFTEFIPYPCILVNDANASGFAEMYHYDKCFNAVYLSLSNSVGGAIIVDAQSYLNESSITDKLYLGDNLRGGEFGHMTLIPNGSECYCGKRGCVDVYCSAKTLSKHTDGKLETFFEEIENGNNEFKQLLNQYLSCLAIEINNLRMIFDCTIILGGYVGSHIEPYISRLKEEVAMLNTFEIDASYIKPCRYRVEASALGAALQHIEAFLCTV
ncbi:ROK family transcriptional regulator [Vallitalea sediminicola]